MATFADKATTIEITDDTDYSSLLPAGRANYNVYAYFFNYTNSEVYTQLLDVTLNDNTPTITSIWTITQTDDIWLKMYLLRLERRGSAPLTPSIKDSYFNTVDNLAYYYDGTDWVELDVNVFDKNIVNYIITNHLRKINAAKVVNDIQSNVKKRVEIDSDCCDEYLNKYIILHTSYIQAQLKFQIGNHIEALDRINYIHENK